MRSRYRLRRIGGRAVIGLHERALRHALPPPPSLIDLRQISATSSEFGGRRNYAFYPPERPNCCEMRYGGGCEETQTLCGVNTWKQNTDELVVRPASERDPSVARGMSFRELMN